MSLYEIEEKINRCVWDHEQETITEDEFFNEMSALQNDAEDCLSHLGRIILNIKGECVAIKSEENRLQKKRKRKEQVLDNIMGSIDMFLAGKSYKDDLIQLVYHKCPPSVDVVDEELIPALYFKPQPSKLDKRLVLDDLKMGADIPGATLVQDKKTLRLK